MIPLRDSTRTNITPYINIGLIMLNTLIFLWQITLTQSGLQQTVYQWGLIPALVGQNPLNLLTYGFLHGGWVHLIGNMWFLWVFGDNIEDRLGHFNYLVFYLLITALAGMAQVYQNPASQIPIVGASGAVAGVLGAYFVTCPRAKVLTLFPVFFFVTFVEIPAVVFLLMWFAIQIFSGVVSIGVNGVMIAWWAHIGGFIAGIIIVNLFRKRAGCLY